MCIVSVMPFKLVLLLPSPQSPDPDEGWQFYDIKYSLGMNFIIQHFSWFKLLKKLYVILNLIMDFKISAAQLRLYIYKWVEQTGEAFFYLFIFFFSSYVSSQVQGFNTKRDQKAIYQNFRSNEQFHYLGIQHYCHAQK